MGNLKDQHRLEAAESLAPSSFWIFDPWRSVIVVLSDSLLLSGWSFWLFDFYCFNWVTSLLDKYRQMGNAVPLRKVMVFWCNPAV